MAPPAVPARRRSPRRHWGLPGQFSDFLFFTPFFQMKEVNEEHAHQMFRLGTAPCADVEEAVLFLACRDGSNAAFSFSYEHRSTPGQNSDRVPQSSNSINMPCEVITDESSLSLSLSLSLHACVCVKYSFRDNFIKSTENYVLQYTKEARTRLLFHRSSIRRFLPSQEEYFVPSETFPARRGF